MIRSEMRPLDHVCSEPQDHWPLLEAKLPTPSKGTPGPTKSDRKHVKTLDQRVSIRVSVIDCVCDCDWIRGQEKPAGLRRNPADEFDCHITQNRNAVLKNGTVQKNPFVFKRRIELSFMGDGIW